MPIYQNVKNIPLKTLVGLHNNKKCMNCAYLYFESAKVFIKLINKAFLCYFKICNMIKCIFHTKCSTFFRTGWTACVCFSIWSFSVRVELAASPSRLKVRETLIGSGAEPVQRRGALGCQVKWLSGLPNFHRQVSWGRAAEDDDGADHYTGAVYAFEVGEKKLKYIRDRTATLEIFKKKKKVKNPFTSKRSFNIAVKVNVLLGSKEKKMVAFRSQILFFKLYQRVVVCM